MVTAKDLYESARRKFELEKGGSGTDMGRTARPIYIIYLFENPDKELVYQDGGDAGSLPVYPDLGGSRVAGFFHSLKDAASAMEHNLYDMHEDSYDAGFILSHLPGIYQEAETGDRMYFVWDGEKQGYVQKEEPAVFANARY